jgi:hypothetical protein
MNPPSIDFTLFVVVFVMLHSPANGGGDTDWYAQ